jgi:hypothetical protein
MEGAFSILISNKGLPDGRLKANRRISVVLMVCNLCYRWDFGDSSFVSFLINAALSKG